MSLRAHKQERKPEIFSAYFYDPQTKNPISSAKFGDKVGVSVITNKTLSDGDIEVNIKELDSVTELFFPPDHNVYTAKGTINEEGIFSKEFAIEPSWYDNEENIENELYIETIATSIKGEQAYKISRFYNSEILFVGMILKKGHYDDEAVKKYSKEKKGANYWKETPVKELQQNLKNFGFTEVGEPDGWFGKGTEKALKNFQKASLTGKRKQNDKVIEVKITFKGKENGFLDKGTKDEIKIWKNQEYKKTNNLSGKDWWEKNQAKYLNSNKIDDLEENFRKNVQKFISALKNAKARVYISTTKCSKERRELMHYSLRLAEGDIKPQDIPNIKNVNIEWDHGDIKKSQKAAQEMISKKCFNIVYKPSLTSNHIIGKAIDMTITWNGTLKIKQKNGEIVEIKSEPKNGTNKQLHKVGKSYGVIKLVRDIPHWSYNGR